MLASFWINCETFQSKKPEVNFFASRINAKPATYISDKPDPHALAVYVSA